MGYKKGDDFDQKVFRDKIGYNNLQQKGIKPFEKIHSLPYEGRRLKELFSQKTKNKSQYLLEWGHLIAQEALIDWPIKERMKKHNIESSLFYMEFLTHGDQAIEPAIKKEILLQHRSAKVNAIVSECVRKEEEKKKQKKKKQEKTEEEGNLMEHP